MRMRRRGNNFIAFAALAFVLSMSSALLGMSAGRSFARAGVTGTQELTMTASAEQLMAFADENQIQLTAGGWVVEEDGSCSLSFTAHNVQPDFQEFALWLISSAEDLAQREEETSVSLCAGEGVDTYSATAEAIPEGTVLWTRYGDGNSYRFYTEAGEELFWTIPGGGELSFRITVADSAEGTSFSLAASTRQNAWQGRVPERDMQELEQILFEDGVTVLLGAVDGTVSVQLGAGEYRIDNTSDWVDAEVTEDGTLVVRSDLTRIERYLVEEEKVIEEASTDPDASDTSDMNGASEAGAADDGSSAESTILLNSPAPDEEEGDANEPTEPDEPAEPTEPDEPAEPTEPDEPAEPTEPDEPAEPTGPDEPVEPTEPDEPAEPTESGKTEGQGIRVETKTVERERIVERPSAVAFSVTSSNGGTMDFVIDHPKETVESNGVIVRNGEYYDPAVILVLEPEHESAEIELPAGSRCRCDGAVYYFGGQSVLEITDTAEIWLPAGLQEDLVFGETTLRYLPVDVIETADAPFLMGDTGLSLPNWAPLCEAEPEVYAERYGKLESSEEETPSYGWTEEKQISCVKEQDWILLDPNGAPSGSYRITVSWSIGETMVYTMTMPVRVLYDDPIPPEEVEVYPDILTAWKNAEPVPNAEGTSGEVSDSLETILSLSRELDERQGQIETAEGGYMWPCSSRYITSPYGERHTDITGAQDSHQGIDIGRVGNISLVFAAKEGTVVVSGYGERRGNYIAISHGGGSVTIYQHLSKRLVSVGDAVVRGQSVGITGSTGISSGPHLHFEIVENGRTVDPLQYLTKYTQGW